MTHSQFGKLLLGVENINQFLYFRVVGSCFSVVGSRIHPWSREQWRNHWRVTDYSCGHQCSNLVWFPSKPRRFIPEILRSTYGYCKWIFEHFFNSSAKFCTVICDRSGNFNSIFASAIPEINSGSFRQAPPNGEPYFWLLLVYTLPPIFSTLYLPKPRSNRGTM